MEGGKDGRRDGKRENEKTRKSPLCRESQRRGFAIGGLVPYAMINGLGFTKAGGQCPPYRNYEL